MAGNSWEAKMWTAKGSCFGETEEQVRQIRKSSRKSAKVFHEKDATRITEKVRALKQLVGGWWGEKVVLTPCNGATPSESSIRQIRTCGSMRGQRS